MTRLYFEIIKDIPSSLEKLDHSLRCKTGRTLLGLAAETVGQPYRTVTAKVRNYSAAVIPITSGQGVITGFTEAVAAILEHIGFTVFITKNSDVAGLGEAYNCGADIFLAADDTKFYAFNLHTRTVVDNSWATAVGFVRALVAAARFNALQYKGEKALVLGLGPVGTCAAAELERLGFRVWVYDNNNERLNSFKALHGEKISVACSIESAMQEIDYIIDATPAAGIIDESMLRSSTVISCPGVPHGLTAQALASIGSGFIHDNLALGVATMAIRCISTTPDKKENPF